MYQNEINLCHSQDKDSMKIILLTKQDTSQVRPHLLKVIMTIIIITISISRFGCEFYILDPKKKCPLCPSGQSSANQKSVVNESLLFSGRLLGVLSCPDKNKHGTHPPVIEMMLGFCMYHFQMVIFLSFYMFLGHHLFSRRYL